MRTDASAFRSQRLMARSTIFKCTNLSFAGLTTLYTSIISYYSIAIVIYGYESNSSPQKILICLKCTHSQVIQDVDEFVSSSDLEKCSVASVSQQWMLCSEWVPSE